MSGPPVVLSRRLLRNQMSSILHKLLFRFSALRVPSFLTESCSNSGQAHLGQAEPASEDVCCHPVDDPRVQTGGLGSVGQAIDNMEKCGFGCAASCLCG
jgi:hypothetical protein